MPAAQIHPVSSASSGLGLRAHRPSTPLLPRDDPALSIIDRWTDRFLAQLAVWGEAATHHRLGSWERR